MGEGELECLGDSFLDAYTDFIHLMHRRTDTYAFVQKSY